MIGRFIEKKQEEIQSKFDFDGDFIYLNDIKENPDLECRLKNYLEAEIKWKIYQENVYAKSNPNFNCAGDKFDELFAKLDELRLKNARFESGSLMRLTSNFAKIYANYLTAPQNALKWFVFRGEPTKPREEILLRLDYFSDYEYLIDKLKKNIGENAKDTLETLRRFEETIEEAESELAENLSPAGLADLLEPMFKFFGEGDGNAIPTEAVAAFVLDKGFAQLASGIKVEAENRGETALDKNAIIEIFNYIAENFEEVVEEDDEIEIEDEAIIDDFAAELENAMEEEFGDADIVEEEADLEDFDLNAADSYESEDESEADADETEIADDDTSESEDSDETTDEYIQELESALEDPDEDKFFDDEDEEFELLGEEEDSDDDFEDFFEKLDDEIGDQETDDEKAIEEDFEDSFEKIEETENDADEIKEEYDLEFEAEKSAADDSGFIAGDDVSVEEFNEDFDIETKENAGIDKSAENNGSEPKTEKEIIKEIMASGDSKFFEFIPKLEGCKTWKEAEAKIDDFYKFNSIDPESDAGGYFKKLIKMKYSGDE